MLWLLLGLSNAAIAAEQSPDFQPGPAACGELSQLDRSGRFNVTARFLAAPAALGCIVLLRENFHPRVVRRPETRQGDPIMLAARPGRTTGVLQNMPDLVHSAGFLFQPINQAAHSPPSCRFEGALDPTLPSAGHRV